MVSKLKIKSDNYLDKTNELIEEIISQGSNGKRQEVLHTFIRQFYQYVSPEYLGENDPKSLYQAAYQNFEFILQRGKDERKVRVYNPSSKEHGFDFNHTILEINIKDMPFLIDSVTAELGSQNYNIYQIIHPVLEIRRDEKGKIKEIIEFKGDKSLFRDKSSPLESVMHFEIAYIEDKKTMAKLEHDINNVLDYAGLAVEDWKKMTSFLNETLDIVSTMKAPVEREQKEEVAAFLEWLGNNNFTFLGGIEYNFIEKNGGVVLETVKNSERGIFRTKDSSPLRPTGLTTLSKEALISKKKIKNLLTITKSNRKSVVHRPVHMDYIGIKTFNSKGEVKGERLFLGLFTSAVYYQSATLIPIIRKKIEKIIKRSGFKPDGHNGKALVAVLESYPRDELLQITEDELFEKCLGIVELSKRPRVRLFARRDNFKRFVSCIVFIPRERFNTQNRERMQHVLEEEFGGFVSDHYTQITDSPLARLHVIIKTTADTLKEPDISKVEKQIADIVNSWHDGLRYELTKKLGNKRGEKLAHAYSKAFSDSYTNRYKFTNAVCDLLKIEEAIETKQETVDIYKISRDPTDTYQLKIYHPEKQIALSDILPTLENMGFYVIEETSFPASPLNYSGAAWIHHFVLKDISEQSGKEDIKFDDVKEKLEAALLKIRHGEIENDALNKLILRGAMNAHDVEILRAYSKYLIQTSFTYSFSTIAESIAKHPKLAKILRDIFYIRFSPGSKTPEERNTDCKQLVASLDQLLADVTNVAEDRIIRRVYDVMFVTLRTNFFQKDSSGNPKNYISYKFDSAKVPELPLPRPYAEIFVYSYKIEGIHLRGGKVARGGLRWSDRNEDFRTEILGLMKAQMVKNAVIVPVGSKGGFVLKNHKITDRNELMNYGIECYKTFLRGLLDITDNIVGGKITPPKDVVRHDGDDPYLVVAADKGTATFSDIANGVSKEYNFWLGDAFASGGSAGYDHKKMAITARGAWVSVERHFNEMGVDIRKEEFTAVGIGDMAGDVFGNGMLLSDKLCLIAAFNHMHIFIDPTPDAKKSFAERKRLFNLPRSAWSDYDVKLISKGGGIFDRKAKTIKLNAEIKKALDFNVDTANPDELIRAILKAPVDLLWNGGIGTYVKAKAEGNVGDRANDNLRINGADLRCKVIGEGGNLGFTQLGRIEYALAGGRINTDAIDNSAGVDCSDHEVNIKIAFGKAVEKKKLSITERDKILEKMTDVVAELVLRDNILQTQAISIAQNQGFNLLEQHARLMSRLEKSGLLNRAIEFLPDEEEIQHRLSEKKGLTRPELAVLLAYSKLWLNDDLLSSNLPDDPYFVNDLSRYFPEVMREKFAAEIASHPLRREIIATFVTNSMINRVGSTFINSMIEDTGRKGCDIARAYTATRDAFDVRPMWLDIEALQGKIDSKIQFELFNQVTSLIERATSWFLRNYTSPMDVSGIVQTYAEGIVQIGKSLARLTEKINKKNFDEKLERYLKAGVPDALAKRIASLEFLSSALDIVKVAEKSKLGILVAGEVYFALETRLSLGWLRYHASRVPAESHWQRLAVTSMIDDIYDEQTRLTAEVIKTSCDDKKCSTAIDSWEKENQIQLSRYDGFLNDLRAYDRLDRSMIIVAIRNLEEISHR